MARVLLVDDDADGSEFVAQYLRRMGHKVDPVPNGHDAMVALTSSTRPDAVILDLRMPQMDGMMLLDVMRSYLRWGDLPVIILSAFLSPPDVKRANDLGVQHIFHKSQFRLEDLGKALADVTSTVQ